MLRREFMTLLGGAAPQGRQIMGRFSAHQTTAAAMLLVLALSGCGSFGGFPGFGNSAPRRKPLRLSRR
jgi:hypothetical protein